MTARPTGLRVTPVGSAAGLDALVVGGGSDRSDRGEGDTDLRLERHGAVHATLVEKRRDLLERTPVILVTAAAQITVGRPRRREVVVGGWRIEVEIESAHLAGLRERVRRGDARGGHGGVHEVRAIIPGRVVSVAVAAGDEVVTGQRLLVVEAMKMQNELRAPRPGVVTAVPASAGRTVELGDLLVVLE